MKIDKCVHELTFQDVWYCLLFGVFWGFFCFDNAYSFMLIRTNLMDTREDIEPR